MTSEEIKLEPCHKFCEAMGIKGHNGELICLDNLHGVFFVGNAGEVVSWDSLLGKLHRGPGWDLDKRYCMWAEHSLGLRDFEEIERLFKEEGYDAAKREFDDQFRERVMEEMA
jgi:hypothetical protein